MSNPKNKRSSLFVSFNDSSKDPTYASLDDCTIVHGVDDGNNPCSENNIIEECPIAPKNIEELEKFVDMIGWRLEFDADGKAVIHTDMEDDRSPYSC